MDIGAGSTGGHFPLFLQVRMINFLGGVRLMSIDGLHFIVTRSFEWAGM